MAHAECQRLTCCCNSMCSSVCAVACWKVLSSLWGLGGQWGMRSRFRSWLLPRMGWGGWSEDILGAGATWAARQDPGMRGLFFSDFWGRGTCLRSTVMLVYQWKYENNFRAEGYGLEKRIYLNVWKSLFHSLQWKWKGTLGHNFWLLGLTISGHAGWCSWSFHALSLLSVIPPVV